jgi:hypothetical protein
MQLEAPTDLPIAVDPDHLAVSTGTPTAQSRSPAPPAPCGVPHLSQTSRQREGTLSPVVATPLLIAASFRLERQQPWA